MITNKKGATLVELIVVIALIGIIFGLGFMIYNIGAVNFSNDTITASNQQNLRLAMRVFAKDIRNATTGTVTVDSAASSIIIEDDTYILTGSEIIKKNESVPDSVFIKNVGQFNVNNTGSIISIEIVSTANKMGSTVSLQTEIVVR